MTQIDYATATRRAGFWRLDRQKIPFLATLVVCVLLYVAAGMLYEAFFSPGVLVNLVNDSAFLGVVAIGMTFVILSGGIDLSFGSIIACTGIAIAALVTKLHWHPALAIGVVLVCGVVVGTAMGSLIHFFALPPFLVTLGGLFFFRGLALVISDRSISIDHPFFYDLASVGLPLGEYRLPLPALVFLGLLLIAILVALFTRFGRNVYAVGGSEPSAVLMGLPVARTKVGVYALSGFCATLGGVVFALYKGSGNAIDAVGLELDAIAAVVVGGTLLTGGVGYVAGTLLGILIFAIIQTAIMFDGTLNSWWTPIVVGALLLAFILLQKLLQFGKAQGG